MPSKNKIMKEIETKPKKKKQVNAKKKAAPVQKKKT
jgi:hypothetical protein